MSLTGDQIFGTHPLDLLSRTSNPELASIGNYGTTGAYLRFFHSNNANIGHVLGINSNNEVFTSNLVPGGQSSFRTGVLLTSNIQLSGSILDANGNTYNLSGGSGGGYVDARTYKMYGNLVNGTRTIQTNTAARDDRVLFKVSVPAGRYFLNGAITYTNMDSSIPITNTAYASVNIYNGTIQQFVAGTATLLHNIPFFSTSTSTTQMVSFNSYIDALQDAPNSTEFVITIEGVGHRLLFPYGTVLKALPVQTTTGYFGQAIEGDLTGTSVQVSPIKSVVGVTADTAVFNLYGNGNLTAYASNTDVFINGTKYVYKDSAHKDYDTLYTYDALTNTTNFMISLTTPAVSGDVVDLAVWPSLTSASNYFDGPKFFQVASTTSSPFLILNDGSGIRYGGSKLVIDGDIVVGGSIYGGSNPMDFFAGMSLTDAAVNSISCNVIGTQNIIDYSITPKKLNLTNGNVGIGTTNPLQTLDIRGSVRLDGAMYDSNNNPIWLPSTSLKWLPSPSAPTLTVPASGAVSYSRQQASYRWIGDDLALNINVRATVTNAPTSTESASNYTLVLPYPVNISSYPADTIVGELWLATNKGANSNLFKAYARTKTDDYNAVVIRAITGSTDETLATLTVGTTLNLQGLITYNTTSINQTLNVPALFTPASVTQDQDGHIGINVGANPPRGRMDIRTSNANPALVVDQYGSGDALQVKDMGNTVLVVDSKGNLGVGTATPQRAVHIQTNTNTTGLLFNQQGPGPVLEIQEMGTTSLFIDANGNVGIGTTQPIAPLHVHNGNVYLPGTIVQCVDVTHTRTAQYTAPNSLIPTEVSVLNLTITPKRINSKIVLQWMINGEVNQDTVFLVYRDGVLIGYNTEVGNIQWSGVVTGPYDNNDNSTPANIILHWIDRPNTLSTVTYSVRIRSSSATAYTLYLNRAVIAPASSDEALCSTGIAWEVCV